MASSSSSSFQSWKYDVFVSFRGEDTRKTFVDFLYSTLVQRGIYTYKDDETLPRGETIGPSLFKAIEESHIAIIVFSENYADSSWCLDELAHIMKCRDERGQIVMPIFYHVNPSDVRNQNWKFAKHYWKNMSKVKSWKKALVDAANISGWVIEHTANWHESKGVEEIVDTLSNNLFSLISNVDEDLIGIRTRVEELRSQLEVEPSGVRMIGIWGMGGGGIKVLLQKALISVSVKTDEMRFSQGRFDMHDLLQEMGHYIVQGEHAKNLENHSRIWRVEDIVSIRSMSTSMNSDRIEAIGMIFHRLDFSQPLPHVLATMKNLRSFHWEYYPPSLLPTNFYPTKLRCLILKYSFQQLLWEGYKILPNLKVLDLSYSQHLITIPDPGGLPVLERMILVGCVGLREIHSSTGCHEKLVFLNLHGCTHLNMFPPITRMPKLTTLILSSCFNLQKFPFIKTNMDSLVHICLRESGIKVLPSSVEQYCTNLVSLDLKYCSHLKSIKVNFCRLKKLKELHLLGCKALETPAKDLFNNVDCCLEVLSLQPTCKNPRCSFNVKFLQFPRFLTSLRLASSELKDGELPSNIFELSNLQVLDLADNEFSRIRSNLVQLPRLKFLNISKCKSLVELPDLPSSIAVLDVNGCDSLIIRNFPTTYKWLWKVSIGYKVPGGENLLQSMFQGNAIEIDHFMSFGTYDYYNSRGLGFDISTRSFAYETFRLQLPWNWYSDYSGFLIYVTQSKLHDVTVIIKQETHTDYQFGHSKEYEGTTIKSMCYIPFSSLMHKALWNGNISFFISESQFKVELVPRRSKGGSTKRSTYCSDFWDEQIKDRKTFTIVQYHYPNLWISEIQGFWFRRVVRLLLIEG
ncbi:hypothetical protein QVD17_31755 [Tagetes erecta]|uniref:TIR domain-containing protein n=1 Tax=Tagetes erecta TaxID=13708 RepID=A0AAD8NP40_TARER|nr:hypothetical protein QVD17_31755 [Tagetes erecta]